MGKHLNTAAKDLLVTMSEKMATRDISDVTGVAEQTLQRLLANPYQHHLIQDETRGRRRALSVHAVNVRMSASFYIVLTP